jgi:hypothetical protein
LRAVKFVAAVGLVVTVTLLLASDKSPSFPIALTVKL